MTFIPPIQPIDHSSKKNKKRNLNSQDDQNFEEILDAIHHTDTPLPASESKKISYFIQKVAKQMDNHEGSPP